MGACSILFKALENVRLHIQFNKHSLFFIGCQILDVQRFQIQHMSQGVPRPIETTDESATRIREMREITEY